MQTRGLSTNRGIEGWMYGGMDENRFAILMYGRIEDWKVVVKIHEVNFDIY